MASVPRPERPATGRLARHLGIAAASVAIAWVIAVVVESDDRVTRWSMATAYVALVWLGVTLSVGPVRVLRGRVPLANTRLRRDFGIWAGALGLVHVLVGLRVHLRGRMGEYFAYPDPGGGLGGLRFDAFGITNWIGLATAGLLVFLLSISNDVALGRLGTRRWKTLQRWSYAVLLGVAAHGFVYQALERRTPIGVVGFGLVLLFVVVLQVGGLVSFRRAGRVTDGPS